MTAPFRIAERLRSFRFAFSGLSHLIIREHNARVHLIASAGVVALAFMVGLDRNDWLAVVVAIALVWITESINTAVERVADSITTDPNPTIGMAKDVAAAAVLIASVAAAIIGVIVFLPHFNRLAA